MEKKYVQYYHAAFAALVTFAVYLPALRNGFVNWDDNEYVYGNFNIHTGGLSFMRWAFTSFHAGNWHPLTWLSHGLDYALWGTNPLGHHLANVIIHALNTFLVVLLCVQLLEIEKEMRRGREGRQPASLDSRGILLTASATGLLFGLHPLHVESVAWVSERKDLLCGLFFLLSMAAYLQAVVSRGEDRSRQNRLPRKRSLNKYYLLSLALFAMALMSKPMAVSLPVVLLVLDFQLFRRISSWRTFRDCIVEKLPFICLSLIAAVVTITAQASASLVTAFVPLWARILVAARALVAYLVNMALPLKLTPFYPYPLRHEVMDALPLYMACLCFAAAVTAFFLMRARKQGIFLSLWVYYLVTLAPVLGLIQVGTQAMADRYTYLPSLGPFFLAGLTASWVWSRINVSKFKGYLGKAPAIVLALMIVATLSAITLRQIGIWNNSIALWDHVIEKEGDRVPLAYNNRGLAFQDSGRLDKAIADFSKAIALNPAGIEAYLNRGLAYDAAGEPGRALADYDTVIRLNPAEYAAYANRGIVLGKRGEVQKAVEDYTEALTLNPSFAAGYLYRADLYMRTGSVESAMRDYQAACGLGVEEVCVALKDRGPRQLLRAE